MKKSHVFSTVLMASVFSIHQVAVADGQRVETVGDASIVTYEKDYFEQYTAVTLLDMLQLVPGAKEILDRNRRQRGGGGGGGNTQERGFGSGGDQILINGKRLAGKSNNIDDTLGRISAEQVEKIELIRGAADGLDVQSQGLVINITMAEGAAQSTTFWQVAAKRYFGRATRPTFLVSHSGSTGNLDYSASVERKDGGFFFDREEEFFDGAGDKTADQFIDGNFRWQSWAFTSNLTYNFADGGVLRLNGLYEPSDRGGVDVRDKTSDTLRPEIWDNDGKGDEWEIGGDYTRSLGSIGDFKALFVINAEDETWQTNRSRGTGVDEFIYNDEASTEYAREKIGRASVTTPIFGNQSLEWGGEVAINTAGGSFLNLERDAAVDPFDTTSDDVVDIKENRYEVFANHTYNASSSLVIQTSLTTEFSKIIADNLSFGATQPQRNTSFTYLKPRANVRYDISDRDQLRFTAEKKVSQLDFENFVTSFNPRTETLEIGNTNIRPEQIWEFSTTYEHRLANDGGSIEIEAFYHDFKDHITKVDFSEYENFAGGPISADEFFALQGMPGFDALRDSINFESKSGNVDSGKAYGVKVRSSIRLGFLNLPQAVVGVSYTYEKKETTDQFTFITRPFDRHSEHTLDFNFRHDITDIGLSYGFEGKIESDRITYDLTWAWPGSPGLDLIAFAEYNVFDGAKLRVEFENIGGRPNRSTFIGYNDHRRFDDSWGRIERFTKNPTEVTVSLQGTF